jgi:outer membrane biosynthesis protein TonB
MEAAIEVQEKKKSRRSGTIGTLAFHAGVLLFLLLMRLLAPIPPPEGGILINFGNSDDGTGPVQPDQAATTESRQESNAPREEQPREQSAETKPQPEKTQDVEEAPVVKKEKPKPVEKPKPKPVEKPKEPEKPKVDEKALYPGKKSQPGQGASGSEGETGKPGDQGDPSGDKNAKSHTGGGKGDSGLSYSLSGRSLRVAPPIDDRSQETGRVVVEITVDKYGNVTNATAPGRGSTTSNYDLVKKSKEAAFKAKFSPCSTPTCAEEQKGTITFVFLVK